MHIGISRPYATPPYPIPDVDGALIARHAERLGFESIFYGEHPIRPLDDPGFSVHTEGVPRYQDTLVMLARASAMTTTLKFGGCVFLAPEHNPVAFAKQLASLDLYSGGRLIVGVGVGWSRVEIELLGGQFERRWAQTREIVQIMKLLWTEERVEYRGRYFTIPPVQCFPQPAQKPWPPVLIGARRGQVFERVVQYGDGWLPAFVTPEGMQTGPDFLRQGRQRLTELAEAAGRDPRTLTITAILADDATRADVDRFQQASVDRVAISLPTISSEREGKDALERIAASVL